MNFVSIHFSMFVYELSSIIKIQSLKKIERG